MTVNIQVRAFSSNKLQLFSYTILEDYRKLEISLINILPELILVQTIKLSKRCSRAEVCHRCSESDVSVRVKYNNLEELEEDHD